ncbi:MAG: AAA family ATPase, partial [Deltaproteobacteria bacterium]|nr:AAA family ATPase [Deltaproteobacteria bacterium]
MKLRELHLTNFRCFENILVSFDPLLTVLVADNGMGKTAILDAIALGFGRLLTMLPKLSGIAPKKTDLRVQDNNRSPGYLQLSLKLSDFSGDIIQWGRFKLRESLPIARSELVKTIEKKVEAKLSLKPIDNLAY